MKSYLCSWSRIFWTAIDHNQRLVQDELINARTNALHIGGGDSNAYNMRLTRVDESQNFLVFENLW